MKEELQSYIYTEKYIASLYQRAAALAPTQKETDAMLAFAKNANQNAEYFNYFYKREFGTNYDPVIPNINIPGGYRGILTELVSQELTSYLAYRRHTYFQDDYEFKETIRAISDSKLGQILSLHSILIDMNNPENVHNSINQNA